MSQVANSKGAKAGGLAKSEMVYNRGEYFLWSMPDRGYQIRVYNPLTKQNDRITGGRDLEAAKKKLDKLYLGDGICPHCGQTQAKDEEGADLVANIIADYLAAHGEDQISGGSIADRLAHVKRYIGDKPVRVGNVTEAWIKGFRHWLATEPFYVGKGDNRRAKLRKPSTVEGPVIQLAAAIRFARKTPLFRAKQPHKVAGKVDFRADIPLLAAMFRYALAGGERRINLLYYLRLAVATWGRPEAVCEADLTPSAKQWVSDARLFRLNPAHREQNNKYRPEVPVGELVGAWLDSLPKKPIMPTGLSKATWARMMKQLKPDMAEGEGGMKLIRRSMATLGRKRLGEANWRQGEMMGGWVKASTADTYAVADPANLGLVLSVTNDIIAEIEALVPGAFGGSATPDSNVIPIAASY
jgi:hypothetical protein